jgi:copper chaperone
MKKTYEVTGMKCQGCVTKVTEKLSAVPGVKSVKVDLEKKQATITGRPFKFLLKRALKGTKFALGQEIK